MFDLKKLYPIIQHLKQLSPGMFKDLGKELQIHCPFCDDATRSNAANHGHMYFAVDAPVFNCFRCSTSGTLLKFLIVTDFADEEIIKYVASFLHHNFSKDHFKIKQRIDKTNLRNQIWNSTLKFKQNNYQQYNTFKEYLISRIGEVNFAHFLIYPGFINNFLVCNFVNFDSQLATSRYVHKSDKFRYKNNGNQMYFFQHMTFDKFDRIVLTEGPFDGINMYLYEHNFKNSFFVSICGKSYVSSIERLIINELLIGNYEINIVFDSDIKNAKGILYKIIKLAEQYNENISIRGFKPLLDVKDVGEFPAVTEV